jgi:hypothetical protein
MSESKCFIKKSNFCIIPNISEFPEQQSYVGYAIVSQHPKTTEEFDKLLILSNYLLNINYLKCSYSQKINDQCKKIHDQIFID